MRLFKKAVLAFIIFLVLSTAVFVGYAQGKYVVPIVMYHNISDDGAQSGLNIVSRSSFARQMAFLKEHGYQVISLHDFVKGKSSVKKYRPKAVVITFDDGYADNYSNAYPVLKQFGFPATVFMISDFANEPGFMTWAQLKEIDSAGFAVNSHTRHHHYLPDVKVPEELESEIIDSKLILERNLGRTVDYFSYPKGGFSEDIKRMVKKAGYKGACATNRGYDKMNSDLYELKRIRINDDDSDLALWAKLSGYYNIFRKPKNPN